MENEEVIRRKMDLTREALTDMLAARGRFSRMAIILFGGYCTCHRNLLHVSP